MSLPNQFAGAQDALHQAAITATGLCDFGRSEDYMPGLERLLQALDDGPCFSPGGREFVWNNLLGVLVSRLFTEKGLKERPDCLMRPVRRPLVIAGVPRTGTTALHKLLSMDEQFQGLEKWLTVFPMPRPPRSTWRTNPLRQSVVSGLEDFFQKAPAMRAAHHIVADEVDECLEVLKQGFCSNLYGSTFRVPGYDAWWRKQSERPSYQRMADVLRLIGADDDRPWLLKNPGHIKELDALLEVFPDACVIQTHRDPVKAIPSLCSVIQMARGLTEGAHVNPHDIGKREMENWYQATEAAMRDRQYLPKSQFLDVQHRDFHADPMGVVRRIYAHFALKLSPETEARMRQRIAADPESQHGVHSYTAQSFGLDPEQIRARFARYVHQHQIR